MLVNILVNFSLWFFGTGFVVMMLALSYSFIRYVLFPKKDYGVDHLG